VPSRISEWSSGLSAGGHTGKIEKRQRGGSRDKVEEKRELWRLTVSQPSISEEINKFLLL